MKKILFVVISLFVLTGCTVSTESEKGKYKEGTYYKSVVDSYGGESNTAIAIVYVDTNGMIKSVYLDTTYTKDDVVTTKKSLGNDYGMSKIGKVEWDQQVKNLEAKIVSEQGLDWLTWKDSNNNTTDSVAGVTMKIDALYKACEAALTEALAK